MKKLIPYKSFFTEAYNSKSTGMATRDAAIKKSNQLARQKPEADPSFEKNMKRLLWGKGSPVSIESYMKVNAFHWDSIIENTKKFDTSKVDKKLNNYKNRFVCISKKSSDWRFVPKYLNKKKVGYRDIDNILPSAKITKVDYEDRTFSVQNICNFLFETELQEPVEIYMISFDINYRYRYEPYGGYPVPLEATNFKIQPILPAHFNKMLGRKVFGEELQ